MNCKSDDDDFDMSGRTAPKAFPLSDSDVDVAVRHDEATAEHMHGVAQRSRRRNPRFTTPVTDSNGLDGPLFRGMAGRCRGVHRRRLV